MEMAIFIGIQASGKSTFYKQQFYNTHIRLNLDMLRTRYRENLLMLACLGAKQAYVIDNTNPTPQEREPYITLAKSHNFQISGYYFRSSVDESLQRNKKRHPREQVPDVAIYATHKKLILPDYAEGFDKLYYVRMGKIGDFSVKEWGTDEI